MEEGTENIEAGTLRWLGTHVATVGDNEVHWNEDGCKEAQICITEAKREQAQGRSSDGDPSRAAPCARRHGYTEEAGHGAAERWQHIEHVKGDYAEGWEGRAARA